MDVMATNQRSTNKTIKKSLPEQVLENPTDFDFDQLVYIVESLRSNIEPLGENNNPNKEAVRIRANPVMHQEIGEISTIEAANTVSNMPEIYTNFLNLIGINGPLPMPYTELILERIKAKDKAGLHFLDIFNHRLVSLWHRLRKKTYPQLYKSTPNQTPIGKVAQDLSGFKELNDLPHTVFFDHYWRRSRSIYALLHMIQRFFNIKATAIPFEGKWRVIEKNEGSQIGINQGQYNVLGKSSVLGLRSWDQSAGFTINLPALGWQELQEFLPFKDLNLGGKNYQKLQKLGISLMGSQPSIHLNIALKQSENFGTKLNNNFALGWNTWLNGGTPEQARVKLL
jgi:type VI secretion system protein ImpH